ncbi:MAG: c-type cytochrome [Deltaproteobacteria bacterium]|nr:c-type cytochrome [Deltaproteobacteria bacterium]
MAREHHARLCWSVLVVLCAALLAQPGAAERPAADVERGRQLYGSRCAVCHGAEGDGRGPVASTMDPPPRDFTKGQFRVRSTRPGDPPSDEDLFQTISRGLAGTAMPAWAGLPEADRWALVDVVKSFSRRFQGDRPVALAVTETPDLSGAAVTRGRTGFRRFGCVDCHGEGGRGDGPSAKKLVDTSGRPIRPFDMTTGRPKRGNAAADLFLVVRSGIEGTPMPGYAAALSAADTWDLVAYVRSLSDRPTAAAAPGISPASYAAAAPSAKTN